MTYTREERSLDGNPIVPWKWMSPEYANKHCFTLASDVWSFGVVLWEMFSFGKEPFGVLSNEELMQKLKAGYSHPYPETMDHVKALYTMSKFLI